MTSLPAEIADRPTTTPGSWLTSARIAVIARRCAAWLVEPTSWIDRRKDTVTVLNDTAVRWQTSVDFGCGRDADGIEHACEDQDDQDQAETPSESLAGDIAPGNGACEALYCAPLFVLPKEPSGQMAYDLTDETGRSLSLPGRVDNALITGEILVEMARGIVSVLDPDDFKAIAADIRQIAMDPPREAKLRARMLLKPLEDQDVHSAWKALAQHDRFAWWLRTAAEASIIVVLFRSHPAARKRIKLSYQSTVLTTQRSWRLRVGWEPYAILIDAPWIEARGYHLEATAPPGMRIEHAWLNDDENDRGVEGGDFTRHAHLYRGDALNAGAGAGTLKLRVSGDGFLTGAWLAALFVVAALLTCALAARWIAPNPTSAPALLLLLPGLLASMVGQPHRHALTTRLLSTARVALIACGVLAYSAAAVVALTGSSTHDRVKIDHRVAHLHAFLWPMFGASALLWLALSVAFVRGRPRLRRLFRLSEWRERWKQWNRHRFTVGEVLLLSPHESLERVYAPATKAPLPQRKADRVLTEDELPTKLHKAGGTQLQGVLRRRWPETWLFLLSAVSDEYGTLVGITVHYELPRLLAPFRGRRVASLERQLLKRLDMLAEQCATPDERMPTGAP